MQPWISLITLGVEDLDHALWFYRDGLGWPVSSASGGNVILMRTSGAALVLYPKSRLADDLGLTPAGKGFAGVMLCHNVASRELVDRSLQRAEEAGGVILSPAQMRYWGGYAGVVADPDGYAWEIAWNPKLPLAADGRVFAP